MSYRNGDILEGYDNHDPQGHGQYPHAQNQSWSDPRIAIPLALIVMAILVVILALRGNSSTAAPEGNTDQTTLARAVQEAESRAGYIDVRATEQGGVIFLDGQANTAADSTAMAAVARSVEGVGLVENRLSIINPVQATVATAPPLAASPQVTTNITTSTLSFSDQLASVGTIIFQPGSANLTFEGGQTVDRVANILASAGFPHTEVHGHTDSDGDRVTNEQLSQQRAQTVVNHLAGRGVPAGKMVAIGFGELHPIEPNITEEGKAANRRIEFVITTN